MVATGATADAVTERQMLVLICAIGLTAAAHEDSSTPTGTAERLAGVHQLAVATAAQLKISVVGVVIEDLQRFAAIVQADGGLPTAAEVIELAAAAREPNAAGRDVTVATLVEQRLTTHLRAQVETVTRAIDALAGEALQPVREQYQQELTRCRRRCGPQLRSRTGSAGPARSSQCAPPQSSSPAAPGGSPPRCPRSAPT
jgi:hypothetical protein